MKKTLTAICATFLLAAPIQIASAASNTSEETPVKNISVEQATNYITYNFQDLNNKWTINNEDLDALIKYAQELAKNKVANSKQTPLAKSENKVTTVKPTAPVKAEDKVTEVKPTAPTKTEDKMQATQPTAPVKAEDKMPEVKPTAPVKTEDKVPATQPMAPVKTEDQVTEAQPTPSAPTQNQVTETKPTTTTATSDVSAFEQQVVELTNAERTKAGLAPLQTDAKLMAAAREKSQDMQTNKYFSHTSPTFGSPFDRMKALGISYKAAGENIAQGQQTPQEVVQAWMDSPGHRANILNASFTHIGVGYVKSGNYWTQQFIQK